MYVELVPSQVRNHGSTNWWMMSRLFNSEKDDDDAAPKCGALSLAIGDVVYENSASKFWSGVVDELMEDFPGGDGVELSTTGSSPLSPDLLRPQNALERDFDSMMDMDFEEVFREALAELAMFGKPGPVTMRILSGEQELLSEPLPSDCVDASVFSYLLVWLLKWAGISESDWNNEFLEGSIVASDYERRLRYNIYVEFRNKHLSEGLYQRTLNLRFGRIPFIVPAIQ